jgi:hypothetical protein
MMADLRLAVRALRATPIVSIVAVLSLALGIGANTAISSLVDSLLLRTLPVRDPQRLVAISSDAGIRLGFKAGLGWNHAMWDRFRQRAQPFDGAVAWTPQRINLAKNGGSQPVDGLRLVLARVALLVGVGVLVGAVASAWLSRFVAALLYGFEPRDPMTLVTAALTLCAVGALAGWLPASRAARIDPADVLREN